MGEKGAWVDVTPSRSSSSKVALRMLRPGTKHATRQGEAPVHVYSLLLAGSSQNPLTFALMEVVKGASPVLLPPLKRRLGEVGSCPRLQTYRVTPCGYKPEPPGSTCGEAPCLTLTTR